MKLGRSAIYSLYNMWKNISQRVERMLINLDVFRPASYTLVSAHTYPQANYIKTSQPSINYNVKYLLHIPTPLIALINLYI